MAQAVDGAAGVELGAGTVLFAGGGTGGHIFPSLAIAERLRERGAALRPHFAVSDRPLDAQILRKLGQPFTPLPAKPPSPRPWRWPAFARGWVESTRSIRRLIDELHVVAVVTMGGFVCGPAVMAARRAGVPVVLVNLDAVPGRANRLLARQAREIFSAYQTAALPAAQPIGLPLRRSAIGAANKAAARERLGLDPQRDTLLVTGASQGAQSINKLMLELLAQLPSRKALAGWQVLHLAGREQEVEELRAAYAAAEVPAKVEAFCDTMGLAWSAASLAISRAGAGSVAEAWANATPTVFLPYPYHKDEHQRFNAEPLTRSGAAVVFTDRIDAKLNAKELTGPLLALMANASRRAHMAELMRARQPADGAEAVASWLVAGQ